MKLTVLQVMLVRHNYWTFVIDGEKLHYLVLLSTTTIT